MADQDRGNLQRIVEADTESRGQSLQPYLPEDWSGPRDIPISAALREAAQQAQEQARKPGRDRRYQTQWVPLSLLVPADYNPRIMPDEDAANLEANLEEHGLLEPLVINTYPGREGVIVGGHQRLNAALNLRWPEIGVIWVYMPLNTEKAANLSLNRIHGIWDESKLAAVIHDLVSEYGQDLAGSELPPTGFSDDEIEELLAVYGQEQANGLLDEDDPDGDVPPLGEIEVRTRTGDLWQLGRHRLLVGDSTDPLVVARLMGHERASCYWTDPPYGVSYVGKTKEQLTIQNDGKFDLDALLSAAFAVADSLALAPGAALYVCEPCGSQSVTFRVRFLAQGWRFHETLVWVKDSMVLGHSDYHVRHETILYGYKSAEKGEGGKGGGRYGRGGQGWYADDAQTTVFEIKRPKASRDHPTMKPLSLVAACVANSCAPGGLVYDGFLGSGTTLLAAEELERRCYGCELSPRYASVILNRWEERTGAKAVLISHIDPADPDDLTSSSLSVSITQTDEEQEAEADEPAHERLALPEAV